MTQKIVFLAQFQVLFNFSISEKNKNYHIPDALCYIASLVEISNKFDHLSWGYIQKTAQKQPKIIPSAGMKTFEISKLQIRLK